MGESSGEPVTSAVAAAERVREIVEAAEKTATEIEAAAHAEAERIRAAAEGEAGAARDGAESEAAAYVERVREIADRMAGRAGAIEQELNELLERARESVSSLTGSLRRARLR